MRIKPGVGSVVGQTDETRWGQVLLTPHAYGIIEIHDLPGTAQQSGIRMMTQITRAITGEIVSLKELVHIVESVFEPCAQTVALMVPVGHIVYIVLRGLGRVILRRGDKLSTLIDGEGAISGELQKGDTLIIVSRGFTEAIPNETLLGVFDHMGPQDVAEKLTLALHATEQGFGAAALVFQVTDLTPEEEGAPEITSEAEPPPYYPIYTRREKILNILKYLVPQRSRIFPRRESGENHKNQLLGILAVGCVVLFVISVILGIRKQMQGAQDQKITKVLADSRYAYEEGTALLELNGIKARQRLKEAKDLLEPLLTQVPEKSATGRELRTLYTDVTNNLTGAMKIYHVTPELYYDVTFLKKEAVASAIALSGKTLVILDRTAGTIYTVSLDTKSGGMVASGGDLAGAMNIAIDKTTAYVEAEKGIVAVNIREKNSKLLIQKPDQWSVPGPLTLFAGNIYVLDTGSSRIWKYIATEIGFSDTREYLAPDTLPDLSRATSFAIDGSVWVATTDSSVLKFTQGREETFKPMGVNPPLGSALRITTSDLTQNLYILDTQEKRVVVLLKDGTYLAQYSWDAQFVMTDFVISEDQKKIFLLSEGKILSIALQ